MQLSNQALGALMLALQNSLMNQTDIVPVLKELTFTDTNDGLVVDNPPIVDMTDEPEEDADGSAIFQAYVEEMENTDKPTTS
tara:strand:+ start:461 stop:706 length:246 start_codon:yes stop_codon:yes gene_type:complete